VLDLHTASRRHGEQASGDLWDGKRTVILLHAMRCLGPDDRAAAEAILARPRPTAGDVELDALLGELEQASDLTPRGRARLAAALGGAPRKSAGDIDRLLAWIDRHGSIAYASAVCRQHADRARAALDVVRGMVASSHAGVLHALIDFTIDHEP
jgi:geranylgeranyl diphosphate synthase type II